MLTCYGVLIYNGMFSIAVCITIVSVALVASASICKISDISALIRSHRRKLRVGVSRS